MASTNPARGMRDFLPSDVRKRNYVIGIIKQVYESYGFEPLETPSVENLETLMGKYGDEGNQLVFKILKRGEKLDEALGEGGNASVNERALSDLALRYDLTVPLARVVANNKNDLPKFFKRYQIQPVWRADRPAKGRFREFYQCDVDAIGSDSLTVECELIAATSTILSKLVFNDFVIKVNHRGVLSGLLDFFGFAKDKHNEVLAALDKLDKIGREKVSDEIAARGVADDVINELLGFFAILNEKPVFSSLTSPEKHTLIQLLSFSKELKWQFGFYDLNDAYLQSTLRNHSEDLGSLSNPELVLSNVRIITELSRIFSDNKAGSGGVIDLSNLWKNLNKLGLADKVQLDPSLARGLSYYTGTIMEINVPDLAGSLGGGGRYDGLIGMFGKEQIPACGFSLGLERILVVMEERGMFPPEIAESTPADVMVTIWNEETIADSLKLANELRASGLRVTVYPQADKEDKQWKYANSIKVPWICTVNATDIAEGMVSFQNLVTRERFRELRTSMVMKITEERSR